MPRTFKLTIAYQGTNYCGWQVQSNGPSIQAAIEAAWKAVTNVDVRVTGSGRTDSGVHALGQVASCTVDTNIPCDRLAMALNAHLPDDIRVLAVAEAPDNFHAIYWAIKKRYRYVWQDNRIGNVFRRDYTWLVHRKVDAAAMHRAAQALVGEFDFASFQAAGSERATTVRTVHELTVKRCPIRPTEIVMEIEANGFLYNMVRNIAGTLIEVGQGGRPESWTTEVREALNRKVAGMTAPAKGLYLISVEYGGEVPQ